MGAGEAGSGRGNLKDGAGCGVVGREKLPAWKRVEDGSPGEGGIKAISSSALERTARGGADVEIQWEGRLTSGGNKKWP